MALVMTARDRTHRDNWDHALYASIAPATIEATLATIRNRLPSGVTILGTLAPAGSPPTWWLPNGDAGVRAAGVLVGPLWTWFLDVGLAPGRDRFFWRIAPWADPLSEHGISEVVETIWRSWSVVTTTRLFGLLPFTSVT